MVNNGLDDQLEDFDDMGEDELYYELDDDRRAELNEIVGLKVLGIELWEESIADEEEEQEARPSHGRRASPRPSAVRGAPARSRFTAAMNTPVSRRFSASESVATVSMSPPMP